MQRIQTSIRPLLQPGVTQDRDELLRRAVRENIRVSADQLRHGSEVLETLIEENGLLVVGAEYSLETGRVDFLDNEEGSAASRGA
jgi:carbonic anhydrase